MKIYFRFFMLILLAGSSAAAGAQEQFGKTRAEVKKDLDQQAAVSPAKFIVKTTDSTVVLTFTEKSGPVRFIYGFDKQRGTCNYQRTEAGCDSCYKKYLDKLLAGPYGWKKINENQYVSDFESRLLLELSVEEKNRYFILFRIEWTGELYDIMIKK